MRPPPFKEYHPRFVRYVDMASKRHMDCIIDAHSHADAVQKAQELHGDIRVLSTELLK